MGAKNRKRATHPHFKLETPPKKAWQSFSPVDAAIGERGGGDDFEDGRGDPSCLSWLFQVKQFMICSFGRERNERVRLIGSIPPQYDGCSIVGVEVQRVVGNEVQNLDHQNGVKTWLEVR